MFLVFCLSFFLSGLGVYAAEVAKPQASSIDINAPSSVNKGEEFTVTLEGKGLKNVFGYEATISFDTDMLEFVKAVKTRIDGMSAGPVVKNNKVLFGYTLISNTKINGDSPLIIYTFRAKKSGNTSITLDSVKLVNAEDDNDNILLESNENFPTKTVKISISGATPTPTPIIPVSGDSAETDTSIPPASSIEYQLQADGSVIVLIQPSSVQETGTTGVKVDKQTIENALSLAIADSKGVKNIILDIAEFGSSTEYLVEIPAEYINMTSSSIKIKIDTPIASLELPWNMFTTQHIGNDSSVIFRIGMADKSRLPESLLSQIGNRPVIELSAIVNNQEIAWNNENAPVTVSINYQPTEEELKDPEHIVVWYIDGQGNVVSVPNGKYDPTTGKVTFTTTHFSKFAVTFVKRTFNDLENYEWARKAIEILASKGIINGTSATTYNPGDSISRGDFMILLVNTLGLKADFAENFSDVKPGDYYYQAIGIAKKLGVATGVGNNMFNPREKISRQDMMCLIDRALNLIGKGVERGSLEDLKKFSDWNSVSSYAVESVASLVKNKIVAGDGVRVKPRDNTSRAETAVLLYRIYQNIY